MSHYEKAVLDAIGDLRADIEQDDEPERTRIIIRFLEEGFAPLMKALGEEAQKDNPAATEIFVRLMIFWGAHVAASQCICGFEAERELITALITRHANELSNALNATRPLRLANNHP